MLKKQTGWIGLGKMGNPMAIQLLNAAYPLTVFNRSIEKTTPLAERGATIAENPRQVLDHCETVFLMLSDDDAVREVFEGEGGLLRSAASQRLIINMSTVSPEISIEMAARCKANGNAYIDAPVSGSVKQAETASLVIMAGATAADFEPATEWLNFLGKQVIRAGETGAGNRMKLAINLLLAIQAQGLAEAAIFAKRNGLALDLFFEILNASALSNVFGSIKSKAILQNQFEPAFALKHLAKDLRLANALHLPTPLAKTSFRSFQQAESNYGEEDVIAIIKALTDESAAVITSSSE